MPGPPTSRGVLDVFLGGELMGKLEDRTLGYVGFDFDENAILAHGVGRRPLSLSLPIEWDPADVLASTAFFSGLLPEGRARQRLAEDFATPIEDTWGLLRVLGRESAGAIVILPENERPSPDFGTTTPGPLTSEELRRELDRLGVAPLGVSAADGEVRLSLAGVQDKLPLVRVEQDVFARPLEGRPSTVIAKPERDSERFPGLVGNEAFCLAVVAELDVPTATFSVLELDALPVLLVDRYDRVHDGATLVRLHQEDACQATAIFPAFKYERDGGPSLARIGDLIGEYSSQPGIDRTNLLALTIANVVLGNCDAHGKNVSFLHEGEAVRLAPAYDIVSTAAYPRHTDALGMRVGPAAHLSEVDRDALLQAAAALGIGARLAERTLAEAKDGLERAIGAAEARAESEGWATALTRDIAAASRRRAREMLRR